MLAADPIQMEVEAAVKTTVGVGLTNTLTVPAAAEIQPAVLVPVME
jgi:hypothetical protein